MENEKETEAKTASNPLRCPKCGSAEIEFITEYHRCIIARIISYFLLAAACILIYLGLWKNKDVLAWVVFCVIFYVLLSIAILFEESKTHAQGICRACGNIWLLN